MQNLQINRLSKALLDIAIHKSTKVAGQTCSTGGAMKGAGEKFPYYLVC